MKKYVLALLFGSLFGLGLSFAKMTDPQIVLDFFDISGDFNPMLLWVFMSALLTTLVGYYLVFKREKPLFDFQFHLSENQLIDKRLIIGAALFGIGWGISGYCPAPVIGIAFINTLEFLIFIIPMMLSISLVKWLKF